MKTTFCLLALGLFACSETKRTPVRPQTSSVEERPSFADRINELTPINTEAEVLLITYDSFVGLESVAVGVSGWVRRPPWVVPGVSVPVCRTAA
jgi:hypothetical protein